MSGEGLYVSAIILAFEFAERQNNLFLLFIAFHFSGMPLYQFLQVVFVPSSFCSARKLLTSRVVLVFFSSGTDKSVQGTLNVQGTFHINKSARDHTQAQQKQLTLKLFVF